MPISIEADNTLAQGYLKINGVTAATVTSTGLTTASLQDSAVTTAKVQDSAITTAKIADANITPAKLSQPFTFQTSKASTSGLSVEFTDIPSWAKRITISLNGVSTSGSSALLVQLGTSSGFTTSGYTGGGMTFANASVVGITSTAGIPITGAMLAGNTFGGVATIVNTTGNQWSGSGSIGGGPTISAGNAGGFGAGSVSLAAALDRIRVTTVNRTDTFDAGTINIAYEG